MRLDFGAGAGLVLSVVFGAGLALVLASFVATVLVAILGVFTDSVRCQNRALWAAVVNLSL